MNPLNSWFDCLADSERGVAFFDLRPASEETIRIEADPITEPRWDRVLPVLEEEQVFMCRMMAPLLLERQGLRVLDVGTGSGVFAITAAKLGCSVTAIDVSPRALRFARHNSKSNRISVVESDSIPGPGEIQLRHIDFLEMDVPGNDSLFDVVIIAPPYNPTCPGVAPALHASAGKLGQDCFAKQLPQASKFLAPGGVCIGNQMVLSDALGEILCKSDFERAFPNSRVVFKRIIKSDRRAKTFLASQYSTFLDKQQRLIPSAEEISDYIAEFSDCLNFSLIYFEIRTHHGMEGGTEEGAPGIAEETEGATPPQGWDDRELLHRRIVEHTAEEHSFPAPALFLEADALPDFPETIAANRTENWRSSCLSYLDSWIAKTRLLNPKTGLFNLVLVDTAPWYPSRLKRAALPQECAVWLNSVMVPDGGSRAEPAAYLETALAEYQKNTIRQQKLHVGPFLHPVFTGKQSPSEWRPVHFSTLDGDRDSVAAGSHPSRYRAAWCRAIRMATSVERCSLSVEEERKLCSIRQRVEWETSKAEGVHLAHAKSNLEQLEVPAENLASYEQSLRKRIEAATEPRAEAEKVLADFNDCHLSMHLRLREIFRAPADHSGLRVTHLIGLPVSIASMDASREIRTLPESYRGGVWIYVEASSWTPSHERYILDLVRILSMLYEDQYTKMSAAELRLIGADASRFNWSHETKHIIVALRRWLMKGTALPDSLPPEIEPIDPSDYAVVPFASLFDAGMAHLQAWTMAASASDLPFCGNDRSKWPADFGALAVAALEAAKNAFLIRLFRKYPVRSGTIDELGRFLASLRNAFPELKLQPNQASVIAINLEESYWQDVARLLLCEFREMLQHGIWSKGCCVVYGYNGPSIQWLEFANFKSGDSWIDNLATVSLPRIDNFSSEDVFDAFKKPLFSSPYAVGDGDRERRNLAESLGVRLEYPTDGDPSVFRVRYTRD
jgi:SAM-dependent methyltransferase